MAVGNTSSLSIVQHADLATRTILVDGKEVPGKYQFVSIAIRNEINKIPSATLVLADVVEKRDDSKMSSIDVFIPGKKIEIKLGYHNNNDTVFKGMIVKNSPTITGKTTELTIECKDETVKMSAGKGNRYFARQKDSDIIKDLLERNGISNSEVRATTTIHEQLVQHNVSDWDFMISRIDVSEMICVINNGKVVARKINLDEEIKLTLTHGSTILEFNAEMDSRIQSQKVKSLVWDFTKQEVRETESDEIEMKEDNPKNPATVKSLSDVIAKNYEMRTAFLSEGEQKSIANAKKLRQVLSKIKGRVKFAGIGSVVPGDFIKLNGVGDRFNGKVLVSAIQHEFTEGNWTCDATLGWNETFFSEIANPLHPASATGQISYVQGLHSAIVTDIEDDSGQYRVKIRLPLVDNNDEGIYARIATLDAGDNRGTFFRPEIGDEVLVGFMNDDPRQAVVIGMLHSSEKAAPLEPKNTNEQKGYVSRSGIKWLFDDDKKSLVIETPGKRVMKLDDTAGEITIEDDFKNRIVMDSNGIRIETSKDLVFKADKSVSISAPQISIKASGTLNLESSGTAEMKSSGVTAIKGSIVNIN